MIGSPRMTANILIYVDERSDALLPSRSILSEKDRKCESASKWKIIKKILKLIKR